MVIQANQSESLTKKSNSKRFGYVKFDAAKQMIIVLDFFCTNSSAILKLPTQQHKILWCVKNFLCTAGKVVLRLIVNSGFIIVHVGVMRFNNSQSVF